MVRVFFQDPFVPGLSFGKISVPMVRCRQGEQKGYAVTLPVDRRRAQSLLLSRTHPSVSLCRGLSTAQRRDGASTTIVKKLLTMFSGRG